MDNEEDLMDNDIVEIITHNYYADGKVIKTETEYKYKEKILKVDANPDTDEEWTRRETII